VIVTDEMRVLTDALFLLWPLVGILVCGAGKALHVAWACDRLATSRRFTLCFAANAITLTALVVTSTSVLSLHDMLYALSLYRDANPTIGWFMTATFALIPFLTMTSILTAIKISTEAKPPAYLYLPTDPDPAYSGYGDNLTYAYYGNRAA
jgi:hypothetical protein